MLILNQFSDFANVGQGDFEKRQRPIKYNGCVCFRVLLIEGTVKDGHVCVCVYLYVCVCKRGSVQVEKLPWSLYLVQQSIVFFSEDCVCVCVLSVNKCWCCEWVNFMNEVLTSHASLVCVNLIKPVMNIYTLYCKSIGSPPSNERFDYFSNFHVYKS